MCAFTSERDKIILELEKETMLGLIKEGCCLLSEEGFSRYVYKVEGDKKLIYAPTGDGSYYLRREINLSSVLS